MDALQRLRIEVRPCRCLLYPLQRCTASRCPLPTLPCATFFQTQALLACVAGFLAASAIPAVVYSFVFQYDPIAVGTLQAVAWGHWGTAFFACAVGLLAHASGSIALTALHCGAGFMLGAALGG